MIKEKFNEFLFWFHTLLIGAYVSIGIFISIQWILFITALHRLHILILGDCLISRWHNKLGGFPREMNFFQYAIYRFTGKIIHRRQERIYDYCLVSCCFIIAFIFS
jgi:hypothetical protein